METKRTSKSKYEVMLDIETLSTENNAKILTIAAIKFVRSENIKPLDNMITFYKKIDLTSYNNYDQRNFHTDKNTLEWWKSQTKDVYEEAFGKENDKTRIDIKQALIELKDFFYDCDKVWANGSCFDCVIIDNAYKSVGLISPWKFWNVRDCRTMFDIGNISLKNINTLYPDCNKLPAHHALYDAYKQIIAVNLSFKYLFKNG